jgi:hypothetical protein
MTMAGALLLGGVNTLAAGPAPAVDTRTHRASGTVELVHAATGSVVINDREYQLSRASTSPGRTGTPTFAPRRGARVEFSYREAQPLPIITEISVAR